MGGRCSAVYYVRQGSCAGPRGCCCSTHAKKPRARALLLVRPGGEKRGVGAACSRSKGGPCWCGSIWAEQSRTCFRAVSQRVWRRHGGEGEKGSRLRWVRTAAAGPGRPRPCQNALLPGERHKEHRSGSGSKNGDLGGGGRLKIVGQGGMGLGAFKGITGGGEHTGGRCMRGRKRLYMKRAGGRVVVVGGGEMVRGARRVVGLPSSAAQRRGRRGGPEGKAGRETDGSFFFGLCMRGAERQG